MPIEESPTGLARKPPIAAWESTLRRMQEEQRGLMHEGRWVGGPADLLSLIGRPRWETYHSAILAWLMDPSGRHGLGDRFLAEFLEAATGRSFNGAALSECGTATEKQTATSRADIVVRGPEFKLVVEVKVDAGEQSEQCARLYRDHRGTGSSFVFLTPSGRPPSSCPDDVLPHWRALSFRTVRCLLEDVTGRGQARSERDPEADGTISSYLGTLRREFP